MKLTTLLIALCFVLGCSTAQKQRTVQPGSTPTTPTQTAPDPTGTAPIAQPPGTTLPIRPTDDQVPSQFASLFAAQGSGSSQLKRVYPLSQGRLLLHLLTQGEVRFPGSNGEEMVLTESSTVLVIVNAQGTVDQLLRLASGNKETALSIVRLWQRTDGSLGLILRGAAGTPLLPDTTQNLLLGDGTAIVHLSLDGTVRRAVMLDEPQLAVYAAAFDGSGGVLLSGAMLADGLRINGTELPKSPSPEPQTLGGRGFLARLEADDTLSWSAIVNGSAASAVTGLHWTSDGVIACGNFGDFINGVPTAIFGDGAQAVTLESHASDDDPAADSFFVAYDSDGALRWVTLLEAYTSVSSPCTMRVAADGRLIASLGRGPHSSGPLSLITRSGLHLLSVNRESGALSLLASLAGGTSHVFGESAIYAGLVTYQPIENELSGGNARVVSPLSGADSPNALATFTADGALDSISTPVGVYESGPGSTLYTLYYSGVTSTGLRYLASSPKSSELLITIGDGERTVGELRPDGRHVLLVTF